MKPLTELALAYLQNRSFALVADLDLLWGSVTGNSARPSDQRFEGGLSGPLGADLGDGWMTHVRAQRPLPSWYDAHATF